MLELKRDLGAFLRHPAVLEGIGKLICFANAHQELRLSCEFVCVHSSFFGSSGEGGEVDVGGDVLLAGGLVGIGADGVLANRFDCAAMTSGELFVARIAVVDDDEKSAVKPGGLAHIQLSLRRDFDALAWFRMNGVAVEEFKFFWRGRHPGFDKAAVTRIDSQGAFRAQDFNGDGVKEFVGEDDVMGEEIIVLRQERDSARFKMMCKGLFEAFTQDRRFLSESVMHGGKEIGKFLGGPIQDVAGEQPASRAEFKEDERIRRAQDSPHFFELAGHEASEDRVHIARCVEITRLAELIGMSRIVAEFLIVEAPFHIAGEGNRAAGMDLLLDFFPERFHNPFRWRSARSCGVRMNISTK